jgi:hypothetical protein
MLALISSAVLKSAQAGLVNQFYKILILKKIVLRYLKIKKLFDYSVP